MGDGLQTFMRMANLYNPFQQQDYSGVPNELPLPKAKNPSPDYGMDTYSPYVDETVQAEPEQQQSILDAFKQSVLNPPMRKQMTYPKSTLNGLTEALKIAAEPSPLEKNRVWVNGQAYQRQQVYTDPVTKEKKFITNVHEPSFSSQVMRAMPAAVSGAIDIANQPYEDAKADWEMKNKGLTAAAQAESNMALAGQRNAQAAAIPRSLDIKEMDARTRQYLASLKDIPESQKLQMVQDGRMSLEAYRAQARYSLQELRGEQALGLEDKRQLGRVKLEGIKQTGRVSIQQLKSASDQELEELKQSGRLDLESAKQVNREQLVRQRGEESRKTKAVVPGGAGVTGQLPSQKKVALQNKTQQFLNKNPNLSRYVTFNDQGFPVVSGDAPEEIQMQINEAIYGGTGQDVNLPPMGTESSGITQPTTQQPNTTPQNVQIPPPKIPGVQPILQFSQSTNQYRISYDGGKTWIPYYPHGKK